MGRFGLFSGAFAVKFREGIFYSKALLFSKRNRHVQNGGNDLQGRYKAMKSSLPQQALPFPPQPHPEPKPRRHLFGKQDKLSSEIIPRCSVGWEICTYHEFIPVRLRIFRIFRKASTQKTWLVVVEAFYLTKYSI